MFETTLLGTAHLGSHLTSLDLCGFFRLWNCFSSLYAFDFLRSMCAELEAFIDSRGPVIVGALDFAARGELGDEGTCLMRHQ